MMSELESTPECQRYIELMFDCTVCISAGIL